MTEAVATWARVLITVTEPKATFHVQTPTGATASPPGQPPTIATDPPGLLPPAHLQVESRAVQIKAKTDCLERRDKYVLTFLPSSTAGTEGSATAKSQDPEESTRACHSEGCSVALR